MPSLTTFSSSALLLAGLARAHFTLNSPPTIGFSDDDEPTAPCGSFTPDFATNDVTDFHVGGDYIDTTFYHAQGQFLYRATLDTTASANWSQIFPIVQQAGLGELCEQVTVPSGWAGQKGVLGVIADSPDGFLYQCSAVNFVSGTATRNSSSCNNGSSVAVSFVADASLTALLDGNSSSSTSSSNSSATSGTAAATSSTKSAASALLPGSAFGALGSVVVAGAMVLLGTALL